MKQFVVPQFISVENKILGSITVRQFVLLMGALLLSILFYRFVDFVLFLFLSVVHFGVATVFAFGKINGRPIHYFFLNFLQTSVYSKRRVWCKDYSMIVSKSKDKNKKKKNQSSPVVHKTLRKSKLSELSLVVDTGGRYQGDLK